MGNNRGALQAGFFQMAGHPVYVLVNFRREHGVHGLQDALLAGTVPDAPGSVDQALRHGLNLNGVQAVG